MITVPEGFDINQLFQDFLTIGAVPIAVIGITLLGGIIIKHIIKSVETSDYASRDKH